VCSVLKTIVFFVIFVVRRSRLVPI